MVDSIRMACLSIVTINGPTRLSESLTKKLMNGLELARSVEEQMQAELEAGE